MRAPIGRSGERPRLCLRQVARTAAARPTRRAAVAAQRSQAVPGCMDSPRIAVVTKAEPAATPTSFQVPTPTDRSIR